MGASRGKETGESRRKITLQHCQIYALETELEDEKGKNLQLRTQLNQDYEKEYWKILNKAREEYEYIPV